MGLEFWGHWIHEPEEEPATGPNFCPACGSEVPELHRCDECKVTGCRHCMVWDAEAWGWFCGEAEDSECRAAYRRERANQKRV